MAIGFPITRVTLDSRVGSLAVQIRQWCDAVDQLQVGVTAGLSAEPTFLGGLGYSEADANAVLGVMVAMRDIKDAITGQGTIPAARNYITTTQQASGID